jgi:hypothetical protein
LAVSSSGVAAHPSAPGAIKSVLDIEYEEHERGTYHWLGKVTIDDPLPEGVSQVSNQGLLESNKLPDEPTDDPDTKPDDDETTTEVTVPPPVGGTTLPARTRIVLAPWVRLAALFGIVLVSTAAIAWRWRASS